MQCLPFWDVSRLSVIFLTGFILLTIVGYQSLLPILQDEGIFSSLCPENQRDCNTQKLRLDMMFNISITALNAATLFWGLLSFKYGPKLGVIIGGILITVSPFIFSFGSDWLCFFSYIAMGIGCGGVLFGLIAIPAQYPEIQGFLFSLLIGFFDASSGVFYIFLVLYKRVGISMQMLFVILSLISLVSCLLTYFFVYGSRFTKGSEANEASNIEQDTMENGNASINVPLIISNESTQHLKELFFLTLWSMFYMLTKYFYITTLQLDKQIAWITNDNSEKVYTAQQIFSVMLLLSGLYSFITGPIIDKRGMKFALIIMAFVSLIGCICSVIPVYNLQLFTMICFVFNRFFYFAMAPLLIVTVFGVKKQQMIYGIILFVSAVFNLLGYLLDDLVTYYLNGNYTIVNLVTGVCCFVVALLLCFQLRTHHSVT